MKIQPFILILSCFILTSCFGNRKLKRNHDIRNNTRIIKLKLKQNGEFRQETEVTNLIRKEKRKAKRRYEPPKLKDIELVKDTFIHEGIWEKHDDTISVHAIIRYSTSHIKNPKIYKIEIKESYDSILTCSRIEIIDSNDIQFNLFQFNINGTSPFRYRTEEIIELIYEDSISYFEVRRGSVEQEFDLYYPKNKKSNYFKAIVSVVNGTIEKKKVRSLWTKHYLIKDGKAIPGIYYIDMRCYDIPVRRKFKLRGFDYSKQVQIDK